MIRRSSAFLIWLILGVSAFGQTSGPTRAIPGDQPSAPSTLAVKAGEPATHPAAIKHVFSPRHGHHVAVGGRHRPAQPAAYKHLKDYIRPGVGLPAPPLSIDYSGPAETSLANIYGNDTLGDCVIAAGYHDLGLWTGNAGSIFLASSNQIVSDYSAIGGYIPGQPSTDRGCDETTAFSYWTSHGYADGSKLAGVIQVDASNKMATMQAIDLFESLYLVVELPDRWISPFPSANGFTWDMAGQPDPNNGHAVMAYGYSSAGILIDTWGMKGTLTWAALAEYFVASAGGNAYIPISQAMLSKASGKNPAGLDWTAIATDFDAMGGNVPVPSPTPVPVPVPVPPTPVPPPVPTPPATPVNLVNVDSINRIINIASPYPIVTSRDGTVVVDPVHRVVYVPPRWTIKRWPYNKAG